MKCPNCSFENEADAKFCENCGQPLERMCPNCGKPVAPNARFCKNCGYKLAAAESASSAPVASAPAASQPGTLQALRQAAPSAVAEKIRAERGRGEGERKMVTALFTDIVDSTMLAESMDPEDWREIVTGAHQRVSEAVYRYEGTIAQLLGDGVLAFFGAPIAHEDDAERAIRAACDILESIEKYSEELRRKNRVQNFRMRVGLNTGLVVVGNIGSDLHMEYLAVGDTVNLAARMQSAAEPNTILIAQNTHRLAANLFEFEDRGRITVKGKAEPIQVYRVLGEKKGASRVRGIAGLSSPMVGRQREFSTLAQILDDVRMGRGSIVSIVGEAGLGKSRLVAEWRKLARMGDQPVRWVEGRCLSYTSSVAHHLSTDILRALIGVTPEATEEETHDPLRECIESLQATGLESKDVYPFLGHLLGVRLEEDMAMRVKYLDGPALQARYVAAYKTFLRVLAKKEPTVIVCEDVHWADPSSVELIKQVLQVASEAPLVFAFVTRADKDVPGWELVTGAHDISGVGAIDLHLAPLTENDSKQLVSNLLEIEALPERTRELILSKAEGNPFFVEEVIRMLIDRGGIMRQPDSGRWTVTGEIQSIDIPDTLQGVLIARIDRLPEDAKRALQVASVIGRRFQVRVLESVMQQERL
jgi:class 3 adenylate cyclase